MAKRCKHGKLKHPIGKRRCRKARKGPGKLARRHVRKARKGSGKRTGLKIGVGLGSVVLIGSAALIYSVLSGSTALMPESTGPIPY